MACQEQEYTGTSIFGSSGVSNTEPGNIVHGINVTKSDVICGRGKGIANMEGNKFYSRLIKLFNDEYQNQPDMKLKKEVAQKVLSLIKTQDPEGRFMRETASIRNNSPTYIIMNDTVAISKITQALRDKSKKKPNPINRKRPRIFNWFKGKNSLSSSHSSMNDMCDTTHDAINMNTNDVDEEPVEKIFCSQSRRGLFQWMSSLSRFNLMNASIRSIDIDYPDN